MRSALVLCVLTGCGRVSFDPSVDAAPMPLEITKLVLQDLGGKALLDVTRGGTYDISMHPEGVTVSAEVEGIPGTVEFVRNGMPKAEHNPPFLSGGNEGGIHGRDGGLAVGANTLAVTAFELPDRGGERGPTRAVDLTLKLTLGSAPSVTRVGFIRDEDNDDSNFIAIEDGRTYSISSLPRVADLRAQTVPAFVGSVRFSGTGPWNTSDPENWMPYTAMGSESYGWFAPAQGTYEVTAVAYSEGFYRGTASTPFVVRFTIVP